jgi:hypothetical protein
MNKLTVIGVVFFGSLLASCGDKSKSSSNKGTPVTEVPASVSFAGGFSIVVEPFVKNKPNITVAVPAGMQESLFAVPQTLPGFHWAWTAKPPENFHFKNSDSSIRSIHRDSLWGKPILTSAVSYEVNLLSPGESFRWPAIVGGGSTSGSGVTTLTTLLMLLPSDGNKPLRVTFREEKGAPLNVISSAKSCGAGCVEFVNFAEAIDTPISFARTFALVAGAGSEMGLYATNTTSGDIPGLQEALTETQLIANSSWNFLNQTWGKLNSEKNYVGHILFQDGCSYQGLEHNDSTLVSIGATCDASIWKTNLTKVVVHEMIHAWNTKRIFPAQNARWNLREFSQSRLEMLYFYEGFTEGFTRILLSEQDPQGPLAKSVVNGWNSTFSYIKASKIGKTESLLTLSRANPMGAYHVGSVLALRLAAEARLAHGADEGRKKFWSLLRTVAESGAEKGGFMLSKPSWSLLTFDGFIAQPALENSQGYTRESLLTAIKNSLQLPTWNVIETRYFSDAAPFAGEESLGELIQAVSNASGLALEWDAQNGSKLKWSEGAVGTWPL